MRQNKNIKTLTTAISNQLSDYIFSRENYAWWYLHYTLGLSYSELASAYDVTAATVCKRLKDFNASRLPSSINQVDGSPSSAPAVSRATADVPPSTKIDSPVNELLDTPRSGTGGVLTQINQDGKELC